MSVKLIQRDIKIKKEPSGVIITFSPNDYCLMKCKGNLLGDYALHYLIDRSEKGKNPDIGIERLYLDKDEAELFKKAGFVEVNL